MVDLLSISHRCPSFLRHTPFWPSADSGKHTRHSALYWRICSPPIVGCRIWELTHPSSLPHPTTRHNTTQEYIINTYNTEWIIKKCHVHPHPNPTQCLHSELEQTAGLKRLKKKKTCQIRWGGGGGGGGGIGEPLATKYNGQVNFLFSSEEAELIILCSQ